MQRAGFRVLGFWDEFEALDWGLGIGSPVPPHHRPKSGRVGLIQAGKGAGVGV